MIIGHLPAGYMPQFSRLQTGENRDLSRLHCHHGRFFGVIGPDIGMLYFQYVDNLLILKGIPGVLTSRYE